MWLTATIPQTILLKIPLKLNVVGSVILVREQKDGPKRQLVSIRLDKHFKLGGLPA